MTTPTPASLERAKEWMDKQVHIPAFDEIPDDDPTLLSLALAFDKWGIEKQIEAKEEVEDLCYQFAYETHMKDGTPAITTGGLSALEDAFALLGWSDPHPTPDSKCEIVGCNSHASCGTPTPDGYKRVCGVHYRQLTAHPRREDGTI